jgi:uncharacterized protein YbgA (DUF1722 family)
MAIGLGTPRTPIRLVSMNHEKRALNTKDSQIDVTDKLSDFATKTVQNISHVSGYIFKKGSPSCGMNSVKLYGEQGVPFARTQGIYASKIINALPFMPVEDEGRLSDPGLRENFIKRVLVYHRWQMMLADEGYCAKDLVTFHQRHKFILMSYNQLSCRRLGQLVSGTGRHDIQEKTQEYIAIMTEAVKKPATRDNHVNVLQHIQGYLKQHLQTQDKKELTDIILKYQHGDLPLIVPVTLLKHHFRHHPNPYILDGYYLNPYPEMLRLMNLI